MNLNVKGTWRPQAAALSKGKTPILRTHSLRLISRSTFLLLRPPCSDRVVRPSVNSFELKAMGSLFALTSEHAA